MTEIIALAAVAAICAWVSTQRETSNPSMIVSSLSLYAAIVGLLLKGFGVL